MHEWMAWQPTKGRRFSSLLLTPARVTVGIGAAMAVLAGFMPWAEGTAPAFRGFEPVFFSGLGGAGDGLVLAVVSAAAAALTLHRTPATSRTRSVRFAPTVLVLLAALTWITGYRAAGEAIEAWERRGGSGQIAPGMWLAGLGIVLMAAGTAWLLPAVIRWERRHDDPSDLVTVGPRQVAEVIAGITGALLGGALGVAVALSLTGPMLVGAIALCAVFGGLLGAYAGPWAVRALAGGLAHRAGGGSRGSGGRPGDATGPGDAGRTPRR
jgi:hypothetical protein